MFGNLPPFETFYGAASATQPGFITTGTQTLTGNKTWQNAAADKGTLATWTPGAYTALTASTENSDINFNLARTVQFATGALTLQRAYRVQAPTYAFVGASTLTDAATVAISGPPLAGTNATITRSWGLLLGTPGTTVANPSTNSIGVFAAGAVTTIWRDTSDATEGLMRVDNTGAIFGVMTNHPLFLRTNNATRIKLDAAGDVILNPSGSALATNATTGFTQVPNCAGAPTGTPASANTGATPLVVDTTNNKIMVYIGGAWKGVTVA